MDEGGQLASLRRRHDACTITIAGKGQKGRARRQKMERRGCVADGAEHRKSKSACASCGCGRRWLPVSLSSSALSSSFSFCLMMSVFIGLPSGRARGCLTPLHTDTWGEEETRVPSHSSSTSPSLKRHSMEKKGLNNRLPAPLLSCLYACMHYRVHLPARRTLRLTFPLLPPSLPPTFSPSLHITHT